MLKTWPLPRTVVCVCVVVLGGCGGGGGGGGQDVITIQTSTMTPLSATVSRVSVVQWLQMHFTLTTRVGKFVC